MLLFPLKDSLCSSLLIATENLVVIVFILWSLSHMSSPEEMSSIHEMWVFRDILLL